MRARALFAAALCAALLPWSAARAAGEDALTQSKALFNVGAQAYERGQFLAAIEAFEQAYKLTPRQGILFSTAQAYRRQYFVDRQPDHLRRSIALYREYLQQVPEGGRRADVVQALEELEPLAARLPPPATDAPPPGPVMPAPGPGEQAKPRSRLMLSRPVAGARVSIDGGKAADLPFVGDVSPGNHKVKVSAPGYFDYERVIAVVEGGVVAPEITLREKPARLVVEADEGAEISVDGRLVGTTPLPKAIELPAGRYFVAVTRRGRKPFSTEVDLARDTEKKITAGMPTTSQRDLSVVLMAAGGAGVLGGGVLGVLALDAQSRAQDIQEEAARGNAPAGRPDEYAEALTERGDLRSAAGIAFGVGAVVGAAGVLLFFVDPPISPAFSGRRPEPPPSAPGKGEPTMEISAAPILGPGIAGAAVGGRF